MVRYENSKNSRRNLFKRYPLVVQLSLIEINAGPESDKEFFPTFEMAMGSGSLEKALRNFPYLEESLVEYFRAD